MNKYLIFLIFLTSCTSFPKEMEIQEVSKSIIDYRDNDYFNMGSEKTPISAPTIEIKFIAKAPFAYMDVNGFMFQPRCYLFKTEDDMYENIHLAWVFFDKLISPKDSQTSYGYGSMGEKLQYSLYIFKELKVQIEANRSDNIDLLSHNYSHIECGLWGVKAFGPMVRSNVISITREEILKMNQEYKNSPKEHDYQSIDEWRNSL